MLALILFLTSTLTILFLAMKYTYWKRRNVPGPTPVPILGNYKNFFTFKKTNGATVQDIYDQFPDEPYVGAYYATEPVLIPRDPEMIKTIMAKDFQYFSSRMLAEHVHKDPIASQGLFLAFGDNWKALRSNLNPMFSPTKLKNMFYLVTEAGKKLDYYVQRNLKTSEVQDFREISGRYILEVIGACMFGLDFDTLRGDVNDIMKLAIKDGKVNSMKSFKMSFREVWPSLYHLFSNNHPVIDKNSSKSLFDLAKQSFDARDQKPAGRNDLVDALLKLKEKGFVEGDGLRNHAGEAKRVKFEATDNVLVAQVLVFFAAGFETSSSALAFTLYELAKQPALQQKLFNEIEHTLKKHNGEITYESLQEMKYMDMVLSETSRKYPGLGIITRETLSDYKFSDYGLKLEKGTRIHIPVWAMHYDPKLYPDPEKYDPERFSPEEVEKRHPYTYLAFGEGQRVCIGMRFSKLQVGVGLVSILRRYRLEVCERTVARMQFDPRRAFDITPDTQIELKITCRS